VLAWIWLDVAGCALDNDPTQTRADTQGRVGATRYFFHYELPKIAAWLAVVQSRDSTCSTFPEESF
jgi:Acetyl-CoA dehydrogenase C-terminal like